MIFRRLSIFFSTMFSWLVGHAPVWLLGGLVGCAGYWYGYHNIIEEPPMLLGQLPYWAGAFLLGGAVARCVEYLRCWLNRKLPWHKHFNVRFFVGFLSAYALVLAMAGGALGLWWWLGFKASSKVLEGFMLTGIELLIMLFFALFINSISDFSRFSYQHFMNGQVNHARQKRKKMELQFAALRSQLSPHFLFNSLNTISSLLEVDAKATEQFIRRLVQTYQYLINTRQRDLVSVEEELAFVKAYNYLLRVRFAQALQVSINVPEELLSQQLPPLTLQMLVENAVKHNVISDEAPLTISIGANAQGRLCVSNNITEEPTHVSSFKVGLENIRHRYAYFTEQAVQVMRGEHFEVSLPLISA